MTEVEKLTEAARRLTGERSIEAHQSSHALDVVVLPITTTSITYFSASELQGNIDHLVKRRLERALDDQIRILEDTKRTLTDG